MSKAGSLNSCCTCLGLILSLVEILTKAMFTPYRISFYAGTQLEQVAHTQQTSTTSCWSDWSFKFGEITESQSWVSVFFLSTSVTVLIPVHTAPKCGTEPIRYVTLRFRDWHGAAWLRYKNGGKIPLLLRVNRIPIRYDFRAGAIERSVTSRCHGSTISGWQQNQRRWRRRGERQKENVYK